MSGNVANVFNVISGGRNMRTFAMYPLLVATRNCLTLGRDMLAAVERNKELSSSTEIRTGEL